MGLKIKNAPETESETLAPEVDEVEAAMEASEALKAMVDRFLTLDKELGAIVADPRIKEMAELKKKLAEIAQASTAPQVILKGDSQGFLEYGKKAKVRELTNKGALLMLLGEDTFLKIAQFKLGDIDKYLNEAEQAQVLTMTYDGGRSLTVHHAPDA